MFSQLPVQLTPFVGRASELHDLQVLLANPDVRCISIVGLGGTGKTRLAIAAATHSEYSVCFLPLLTINTRQQIILALAQAIGFQFYDDSNLEAQLLKGLQAQTLLLVLDNMEHLTHEADFISALLSAAPHLKVLVTSREQLNLRGEVVFPIHGFHLHDWTTFNDAHSAEAVQFFHQSARRIFPKFTLTEPNFNGIKRICHLLDGMPLGIELAAAWVNAMSVEEIADEIAHNSQFLEVQFRDSPARHQSLWGTFQASWERLSPDERQTLSQLTIFTTSFTRRAAQHITGADMRTLHALVQKSLLTHVQTGRYDIHNLLRQYVRTHLQPAALIELQQAHSRYYLSRLGDLAPAIKGGDQRTALDEIEADFDNVRIAWETALQYRNKDAVQAVQETLFWFCMARNRYIEGEQLFEQAERVFGASQGIDAALKLSRFWLRRWREGAFGDHQDLEELLGWFQHAGDLAGAARCKLLLGDACRQHLLLTESLHYYQTHEDHFYAAWALHFLAREATDIAQAVELQQRSLALRRQIKDFNGVIYALYNLSTDSLQQGLLQESTQAAQEMLDLSLHMNEHSGQLMAYISLSLNMLLRGQPEQAAELNNQAHMLAVKINHPLGLRYSLLLQALCALQQEQLPLANDLLHQLAALAVPDLIRYFEQLATAMLALGQGEHQQASQPLAQALRYALTVRGSGVLVWCLALGAFWADRAGFLHLAEQSSVAHWITRWPPLTQVAANLPIAHLNDTTVEESARQLLALLSPDDSAGLFASSVLTANESLIEPLSIRELEVLTFIAKGLSNQDIAERLTVEISTIKKHITNIYGKLGVSSRTQAMLTARELGLVDFR